MIKKLLTYFRHKTKTQGGQVLKKHTRSSQRGQILFEYILILVLVIGIAKILIDGLVKRSQDEDERGVVIKTWVNLSDAIAEDPADEVLP